VLRGHACKPPTQAKRDLRQNPTPQKNNEKRLAPYFLRKPKFWVRRNPNPTDSRPQTSSDKIFGHKDTKGRRPKRQPSKSKLKKIMKRGSHLTFLENLNFGLDENPNPTDSRPQTLLRQKYSTQGHQGEHDRGTPQNPKPKKNNEKEARTYFLRNPKFWVRRKP
jgi:hypothetical protein